MYENKAENILHSHAAYKAFQLGHKIPKSQSKKLINVYEKFIYSKLTVS